MIRPFITIILVQTALSFPKVQDDSVISAGDLGQVRGVVTKTRNTGRNFIQFKGIPYAQPPVGNRRFMPSELKSGPLTSDGSPFNASSFASQCPQAGGGTEDCLYLNIAAPLKSSLLPWELVPVIVYIHGGVFIRGNANKFDGQLLLRENLVVVSFNYRIGVFGYFGMSSDLAPGNSGLYDNLTVLRWVKKYIAYFGGNPKLVTLTGQSSGAASVTHLLLSPLSKGLFHRAIALSGTALNAWAVTDNPVAPALRVAKSSGCYNSSSVDSGSTVPANLKEIMDCMKKVPVQTLLKAQDKFQTEERLSGRNGFEAVDPSITFRNLKTTPTVLPDYPINILKRGSEMKIPLLLGATKNDGAYPLGFIYLFFLVPNNLLNNATFLREDFVPTILRSVDYHLGENESTDSFARKYLKNCKDSGNFTQMLPGLVDAAALQLAELHSKRAPTYLYSFDFKGTRTQHLAILPFKGGVAHSDDTLYLFPAQDYEFNSDEALVSKNMITIWKNFAKTGSPESYFPWPGIKWPAFNTKGRKYVIIDKELMIDNDYEGKWVDASKDVYGNSNC